MAKRPSGKEFRDGTLGDALDDVYEEINAIDGTSEAGVLSILNTVSTGTAVVINTDTHIKLKDDGTDRIQIDGTGIGFFNATPVAQQDDCAAVTDTGQLSTAEAATINAIRTALRNLGLMA